MSTKSDAGSSQWLDPDDAPELDDDVFEQAEIRRGDTLVRLGRPPRADTKPARAQRIGQRLRSLELPSDPDAEEP
jgi:hypothetical protein